MHKVLHIAFSFITTDDLVHLCLRQTCYVRQVTYHVLLGQFGQTLLVHLVFPLSTLVLHKVWVEGVQRREGEGGRQEKRRE